MNETLQGKKVVVLGGTSGIGLATAEAAIAHGAEVVVTSSQERNVARAVSALGSTATGQVANLLEESQIRALFERIGELDHLVFTAGESLTLGRLEATDLALARQAYELRVFGAMAAAKHAAKRVRGGGSITLTHGIAGQRPHAGWTIAASICGAMVAFTRALAMELAPIRVNAVSPGFVRTPLWSNIPEADREQMYRDAGKQLLVGRVGEPREIAAAYLHLIESGFSSGQTIVVDGGGLLT